MSFSVDINTAKEVATQLIQTGKVFKAYLGFALQEVSINSKIVRHYHLPNQKGLFVVSIEPNSPASRSQVKEGDIITFFHGKAVNTLNGLFKELTHKEILTLTDISVIRHTELLNFSIAPMQKAA